MSIESVRGRAEAARLRAADWGVDSGWIRNDADDLADDIELLLAVVEAAKEYAEIHDISHYELAVALDALEAAP